MPVIDVKFLFIYTVLTVRNCKKFREITDCSLLSNRMVENVKVDNITVCNILETF